MEERKERRLRIKWTPNLNKKFNEAIRRLGEKATAIPILEYMNVPQLTRKQVENRLQQYRVHKRQAQLAQHASSSSLVLPNHPNVLNSHETILTPNTCNNTFFSSTK
ncbi:two-component response regulator ARR1-like [Solanum pennellii]|uniref:Two-component response regulator ARR1-like n=1 Tax=Solanum pennellii TaxID=28526 RepID=A0ABM1VAY5_SOLPN|nr:two-component response regulator ARR1-like [Solanum pennellii]